MRKSIYTAEYDCFLDTLRTARKAAGLSQREVAERIGALQTFVSKVELGERRLDLVELREFCAAMGIPLEEFVRRYEAALAGQGGVSPDCRSRDGVPC